MLKVLFYIFCLMLTGQIVANKVLPIDGKKAVNFEPYLEYFTETAGEIQLTDAMRIAYHPPPDGKANFGFQKKGHWFHLRLALDSVSTGDLYLVMDYPLLDKVDFYILTEGAETKLQSGDMRPFENRSRKHRQINVIIPLTGAGSIDIYFRVEMDGSLQAGGQIIPESEYNDIISSEQAIFGIYAGAMFVLLLYHLIIFAILREKIYWVFSAYVGFYLIAQMCINGTMFAWFLPGSPQLPNLLLPVSYLLFGVFSVYFQIIFLPDPSGPVFSRILRVLFYSLLTASVIALFVPYKIGILAAVVCAIVFPPILMLFAILRLKDGYKPARYYLLGWSFLLLGIVLYGLKTANFIPTNTFTEYATQIGSLFQAILFSLALADRIDLTRIEKENAERESLENLGQVNQLRDDWTKKLEEQVTERTLNLEKALLKVRLGQAALFAQKREIEALTEAAISIQESTDFSSITRNIGKFLAERYKIDQIYFYTRHGDRAFKLENFFSELPKKESNLYLRKKVFPVMARSSAETTDIIYFEYDKELSEYNRIHSEKKKITKDGSTFSENEVGRHYTTAKNSEIVQRVEHTFLDLGEVALDNRETTEAPGFVIAVPLHYNNKMIGLFFLTTDEPGKDSYPVEPELLSRLGRLVAGPLQMGLNLGKMQSDLANISQSLESAETQLTQAEKMSSLGQMVAGISHEIANPVNYISIAGGNLKKQTHELQEILISLAGTDEEAQPLLEDFNRRFEQIKKGLADIELGVNKVAAINHAMRNFSRLDSEIIKGVLLDELISEALVILNHKIKFMNVITDFEAGVSVDCHPSQVSQVIMNLISNAADAISEMDGSSPPGKIHIFLRNESKGGMRGASVIIEDSGPGVPKEIREKIFDAFYTTKPVGVGTGLGLAVSANIIKKHNGLILVESSPELGGAMFTIFLPAN